MRRWIHLSLAMACSGSGLLFAAEPAAPAIDVGTPTEIVENADVRRVYLGEHFKM